MQHTPHGILVLPVCCIQALLQLPQLLGMLLLQPRNTQRLNLRRAGHTTCLQRTDVSYLHQVLLQAYQVHPCILQGPLYRSCLGFCSRRTCRELRLLRDGCAEHSVLYVERFLQSAQPIGVLLQLSGMPCLPVRCGCVGVSVIVFCFVPGLQLLLQGCGGRLCLVEGVLELRLVQLQLRGCHREASQYGGLHSLGVVSHVPLCFDVLALKFHCGQGGAVLVELIQQQLLTRILLPFKRWCADEPLLFLSMLR